MGRTGARLKKLERKNEILFGIVCRQIVLNSDLRQILDGYNVMLGDMVDDINFLKEKQRIHNTCINLTEQRLTVVENLLQPVLNDITILRQSNFDYHFSLLCKSLDEARETIARINARLDELENTAWRKFCRWISLLFTV